MGRFIFFDTVSVLSLLYNCSEREHSLSLPDIFLVLNLWDLDRRYADVFRRMMFDKMY